MTPETEREKIADAIDPRKAPIEKDGGSVVIGCTLDDLIAASDLIRSLSPSPDSLRLGILAGKIDGRMPDEPGLTENSAEIVRTVILPVVRDGGLGPIAKSIKIWLALQEARHSPARADLTELESLTLAGAVAHFRRAGFETTATLLDDLRSRLTAKPEPQGGG